MKTIEVWNNFNDELYFFILKKVKDKNVANDIFQNTFLKIHTNVSKLKDEKKVRSWIYQIARNETVNYLNNQLRYINEIKTDTANALTDFSNICCFDKLIDELPKMYKDVIEMAFVKGIKQKDIAEKLGISLENVKVRVGRGKELLKTKFRECCNYQLDSNNKLTGDPDCAACSSK
ncbi:MAG: sigma-70 family RNA polymerase sigma factor [Bacteroidota bacterium]